MPSKVYFLPASENEGHDILAEKTRRIFGALGLDASVEKDAFVGIKIHFGKEFSYSSLHFIGRSK